MSYRVLKRNIKTSSQNIKSQAYRYLALVCPKLEYACSAWDPHVVEGNNKIEIVQRRDANTCL